MPELIDKPLSTPVAQTRIPPTYRNSCVHQVFERQASLSPDAVALIGAETLSYRQVNDRANHLAAHLRTLGIGQGDRVGIFGGRSIEMVIGQLGIMKSGAAHVPLDPDYPSERLSLICRTAEIRIVLTSKTILERWSVAGIQPVCLEEVPAISPLGQEIASRPNRFTPDDVAYVMYTSGSAGVPKGVMIPHRGVVRLAFGLDFAKLDEGTVSLHLAPVTFDASTFEIWATLLRGGRSVIYPELIPTAAGLKREIERHRVNTMWLTASLFNAVVEEDVTALLPVRQLLIGGEALSAQHVRRALKALPNTQIINGYGPTENTTFTCCYPVPRDLPASVTSVPIGKPIGDTSVYILDEALRPATEGQLYSGGAGLACGYLGDPDLTAEKFIANPFGEGRLYKTGDRVRLLPDGNLDFIGRMDDQIKVRGFRIEPGEIESALGVHPLLRQAAVVAIADSAGDKQLVAYVVPREPDRTPETGALKAFLAGTLPHYMLPSRFISTVSLPLTAHGKVDRAALSSLAAPPPTTGQSHAADSTIEEQIAAIWKDILGLAHVGAHDNFFSVGGHSLLAVRVALRMRKALGIRVPVRTLFEKPTVAELAAAFRSQVNVANRPNSAPGAETCLQIEKREPEFSLSSAQEEHWVLNQLYPGTAAYHDAWALRLEGRLDRAAVQNGLDELVRRHQVLRTIYRLRDDVPVQVITDNVVVLKAIDLCQRDDPDEALRTLLIQERQAPFDLSRDVMMRASLFQIKQNEHVLLLTLHHIASDGWSMGILHREFLQLYSAYAGGEHPRLTALPMQYTEYSERQRALLNQKVLEPQRLYWTEKLHGCCPSLNFTLETGASPRQGLDGAVERLRLSPAKTAVMRAFGVAHESTEFMFLLAVFQLLLHRLTGQDDITVGVPVAGRNDSKFEPMIGCFVNTLVLRSVAGDRVTFEDWLRQVCLETLGALAHQDYPFDRLIQYLNPHRHARRVPLFDAVLNYQPVIDPAADLGGLKVSGVDLPELYAIAPITLYADSSGERITLRLAYQTSRFSAAQMRIFLDQFESLLDQIIENPGFDLHSYSLTTSSTRALLPDPAQALDEPVLPSVPEMFRVWTENAPDTPAVCQQGQNWTYGRLAQSAHELAGMLNCLGLRAGTIIAIAGNRSFGIVASMLAVLENRCVFLPIDPALPLGRASVMMQQASPKLLMCVGDLGPLENLTGTSPQVVRIDPFSGAAEGVVTTECEFQYAPPQPDDPAYIFFTSGSTGTPKGVLGCHKGLSHFLAWEREAFSIGPGDRVAQLTNFSFDVVLRDVFLPLTSGATLCLPPETVPWADPLAWLEEERISILHTGPALATAWLESRCHVKLRSLRWTLFAGEPLTESLIYKWRERFPESGELVNLYGPTETTMAKCFYRIPADPAPGVQPIGRPLPQTQALVVSSVGRLCGIGEPGEITLRTPFRTLGYLESPQQSSDVYRTGDRGCFDLDGSLRILGRLDDQVKILGIRIEPQEVAAVLSSHPAIRTAFVSVRRDENAAVRLIAYVVPDGMDGLTLEDLRPYLRERLLESMIPSEFVILDRMPLSATGKVNRQALPEPRNTAPAPDRDDLVNPTEAHLIAIWQDLLNTSSVGVHSNFFDLGGHSLLGVRLMSRIERALGVTIPVTSLFAAPTIRALATMIAEGTGSKAQKYVKVQEGQGRPLIFFHGDLFGGGLYCRKFARSLGADQGFVSIAPPGWDGGPVPHTIEEIAAEQLQNVLEIQPEGPFTLGGYCNGGLVAFELARILQSLGKKVDLVALVDAPAYSPTRGASGLERIAKAVFKLDTGQLLESRIRLRESLRELKETGLPGGVRLFFKKAQTAARIARKSEAARTHTDPRLRAARAFVPSHHSGRIVLFCSEECQRQNLLDESMGWRRVTSDLRVHRVPGDHTTCLTQHVDAIALELKRYL